MIDLDIEMTEKLCRHEIARAERSGESVNPYCLHHTPAHAMLELISLLRKAEKDAARYRWLCTSKIYDQFDSIDQVFYANKGDTDKAIDEAMQCSK